MRAAAGLLLLLMGLCGSQAQVGGDADVWTEVRALRAMLMEAMVKQTTLQSQVKELKAEQARGRQSQNDKLLYFWCFDPRRVSSSCIFFVRFCAHLKV